MELPIAITITIAIAIAIAIGHMTGEAGPYLAGGGPSLHPSGP
jgi:hypothetical protein